MSIRKKLILSNIMVFLIPLISGSLIMGIIFNRFDNRTNHVNVLNQLSKFESSLAHRNENQLLSLCHMLEQEGYHVYIESGDLIYESKGYQNLYALVIGDTFKDRMPDGLILSNDNGTVYGFTFENNSHRSFLSILSDDPHDMSFTWQTLTDDELNDIRNMVLLAILSIILVIILTISGLTWLISKSILKPLKLLQEGTRQIKSGNLHYQLNYHEKNEFGEVCADFDDMRLRLAALKEEEKKYDDNRKELIAGITHDLNTPLTSIKGFVSGLLEGIVHTPEKKTAYLQNIKHTADKMSGLVEELLLYSTLDMDGVSFSFEKVDLTEYFKDCLSELSDEYKQNGIQLHLSTDGQNTCALIDRLHFNRVVLNLLGNSVKYRKHETGHVFITLAHDGQRVHLSFKDDGMGIPPGETTDIFKVFYRSDKSRSQTTGGNGLGLAIVQRIITAHGGDIQVNSLYTDGLEVIVTLPLINP